MKLRDLMITLAICATFVVLCDVAGRWIRSVDPSPTVGDVTIGSSSAIPIMSFPANGGGAILLSPGSGASGALAGNYSVPNLAGDIGGTIVATTPSIALNSCTDGRCPTVTFRDGDSPGDAISPLVRGEAPAVFDDFPPGCWLEHRVRYEKGGPKGGRYSYEVHCPKVKGGAP